MGRMGYYYPSLIRSFKHFIFVVNDALGAGIRSKYRKMLTSRLCSKKKEPSAMCKLLSPGYVQKYAAAGPDQGASAWRWVYLTYRVIIFYVLRISGKSPVADSTILRLELNYSRRQKRH